ncbi:MAG: DUF2007 domain-containing protein [Candidatus Cloacimonetes bacterium]|nr:DUF2007 domain-containing protein [Candidatus Cloacimonadota bacterium]
MFCPNCKGEFLENINECPKCKIPLIKELSTAEFVEFVTVFTTGDPMLIALAKSLLEEANINYFVKNENAQDLFGLGRLGTGFNLIVGEPEIIVSNEDREEADLILKELLDENNKQSDE